MAEKTKDKETLIQLVLVRFSEAKECKFYLYQTSFEEELEIDMYVQVQGKDGTQFGKVAGFMNATEGSNAYKCLVTATHSKEPIPPLLAMMKPIENKED